MSYTRIKNWLQFLTDGIWRITEDEISPVRRQIYSCIKIVYLSVNQFLNDRIQIRTSALTYSTLLSIIPILAILFAIARGFGFDALMEIQLRKGVASQQSELIISWINSYLEHAQSGIFIGIGLIMLLWTVLILTDNIERSFNAIWQVKHPRSVFRKITDYFSMILLLPLLIVISSGLTIFMTTYIKNMDNFLVLAPILKFLVRLTPICTDLGNVYRTLHIYPKHQSQIKARLVSGNTGRNRLSGISVLLCKQPDMGFKLQRYLRKLCCHSHVFVMDTDFLDNLPLRS